MVLVIFLVIYYFIHVHCVFACMYVRMRVLDTLEL